MKIPEPFTECLPVWRQPVTQRKHRCLEGSSALLPGIIWSLDHTSLLMSVPHRPPSNDNDYSPAYFVSRVAPQPRLALCSLLSVIRKLRAYVFRVDEHWTTRRPKLPPPNDTASRTVGPPCTDSKAASFLGEWSPSNRMSPCPIPRRDFHNPGPAAFHHLPLIAGTYDLSFLPARHARPASLLQTAFTDESRKPLQILTTKPTNRPHPPDLQGFASSRPDKL